MLRQDGAFALCNKKFVPRPPFFITFSGGPERVKQNLSLHPLDLRRNISLLCLFHKYVYNSAHSKIHLKVPTNISRRVNNQHSFSRQYGKTDAFNLSALPMAIRLWNGLPDNIAAESKGDAFRNLLHAHFFS